MPCPPPLPVMLPELLSFDMEGCWEAPELLLPSNSETAPSGAGNDLACHKQQERYADDYRNATQRANDNTQTKRSTSPRKSTGSYTDHGRSTACIASSSLCN